MTRRRWIADEVIGNTAALVGDHAAHLARVLRAEIGQEFDVATRVEGRAEVRRGTITSISENRVEFALGKSKECGNEKERALVPAPKITLALAIFKFDRMEWAIEKCTELGVSRIVPVISRRTDSHLAAASAKRVERWQRIARQASEQSRRTTPPEILPPIRFADALTGAAALRIVLAESEERTLLRDVLKSNASASAIILAVGPEGGWTEDELQSFRQAGWISVSLGNTILRAETAAIAATAVVTSSLC